MLPLSPEPNAPFPPVAKASKSPNGLLAFGGDLSVPRLLNAYQSGIFPWYGWQEPILWWSPDPRLVLFPNRFHLSKSLKKFIKKTNFQFCMNRNFRAVVEACALPRDDGLGTWIVPEMIEAYTALHKVGWAHSAEIYDGKTLVGGLYGLAIDRVFFGESMFSHRSNTSKMALYFLCRLLKEAGFALIDCQVDSEHLRSLGAELISRARFMDYLGKYCSKRQSWQAP